MEKVMLQIEVPAEAEAVREFIKVLLQDLVDKKDISSMVSDLIPKFINMVGGMQKLSDEVKDAAFIDLAGLMVSDIVKILVKK